MTDQQSHSSGSQAGTSGAFANALGGARADVEQLLAAFLADPGGEAGQMTRTMLFNYMLKQQTQAIAMAGRGAAVAGHDPKTEPGTKQKTRTTREREHELRTAQRGHF